MVLIWLNKNEVLIVRRSLRFTALLLEVIHSRKMFANLKLELPPDDFNYSAKYAIFREQHGKALFKLHVRSETP